ncbi:valine--tRNA ligase [Patescibacteria group bacterium]|nr:valine--tRNA ligase [Patescibacteria group bacterium]
MNLKELKNWNIEAEKEIAKKWENSNIFNFNPKTRKKVYSIDTPPPYVNAPVHIGQAITYCYMDFFARYKRMRGYEVLFPLGLDRNGLPIEIAAEKKYNISAFKMSRAEFLDYCKKLLNETSYETKDTFSRLGISFSSYKEGGSLGSVYLTDSEEYRTLTQKTFIELYKKGLVYEDMRITNWDPKLQTTIADSEIEYKNLSSTFNYVKWKVKETNQEIIIATTRPELICTCGRVIFNPKDKRYKSLNGKTAISPLFNKEVPIKAHPLASLEKGTGLAMMCSMGDLSDIQFFRDEKIKPLIAIDICGEMNKNAGFLAGLKVREARKKIIEELKDKGLLEKQENITHRTPISERSGAEIEFIEMPEFYLKQLHFKDLIKKLSKKIKFYPQTARKILDDWIDSISIDWPISRRRFYSTEIPLWYAYDKDKKNKFIAVPPSGHYYKPWNEKVPLNSEVFKDHKKVGQIKDPEFKNLQWTGELRVFDTWMDSSISELFIIKYLEKEDFFKKSYPVSLRPQGKEIIRTWLYYTLLRGFLETGKMPFKEVWINQHILDGKNRKMSKSLGNVIDPQYLLSNYGAEAIRFWSAIEGDLSKQDLSCSEERIKAEQKTLNKILNISKFVMLFEKPKKIDFKITPLDKLFIDYIEELTNFSQREYEKYNFYGPAIKLRNFLWDLFASHYIEIVKNRAYNQEENFSEEECKSAKYTLHFLLERLLILLYPIIPQITSFILLEKGIKVLDSKWPVSKNVKSNSTLLSEIISFNSKIWKEKKEKGLSLKSQISDIEIPKKLKDFEKDLKIAHSLV